MKRFILLMLCVCCLTACTTTSKKWNNSNIAGRYAKKQPSLKDDFYQSVNYEWFKEHKTLPENRRSFSLFDDANDKTQEELLAMFADSECCSHEEELVKILYNQMIDEKTRNELGTKPLQKILNRYKNISTIEELWQTAYTDDMPDCIPIAFEWYATNQINSNIYTPYVFPVYVFGDLNYYEKEDSKESQEHFAITKKFFKTMLVRCGWTKEQAEADVQKTFEFEKKLTAGAYVDETTYAGNSMIYNKNNFPDAYPNLPILDIIEKKGGRYRSIQLSNIKAFNNLNKYFVQENIEELKLLTMLICIDIHSYYLDVESMVTSIKSRMELKKINVFPPEEEILFDGMDVFSEALSIAWLKRYFSEQTKKEVTEMTEKIISKYENRFTQADWIRERTKKNACDKLKNINYFIGYAFLNDYTDFELYDSSTEDSLLKNIIKIKKNKEKLDFEYTAGFNKKDHWVLTPLTSNACYIPENNSINICAAIVNGVFYDSSWSYEKNLATIGAVIAHEITHCFDVNGSNYDKDGNNIRWWDSDNYQTLVEKSQKFAEASLEQDVIKPVYFPMGYWGEVTADAGAMAVLLDIAEEIPGFNYDEFFRSYAELWREVFEPSVMDYIINNDVHPAGYIRANYVLQQFEKFYETYGITEGDGMYLAPEERYKVW